MYGGIIIIDIKINSKDVRKNDTFLAIKGINKDGHDYIEDAIKNGATKVICEKGSYSVNTIKVNDTTKYLEDYLKENYYDKISDLILIGITGTSGKTTTSFLVYQMLKHLKQKVAYIGTIGFYMDKFVKKLDNTTPNIYELYDLLLTCKENNIKYVVMEVSSHSLSLGRLNTLLFDEVAFTNLSKEHLDYHKTMKEYAKCKKELFNKLRNKRVSIINKDNKYYKNFALEKNNNIFIGQSDADLLINNIEVSSNYTKFDIEYKNKNYNLNINLVGKYNVYNYLTALLLVNNLGFDIDKIIKYNDKLISPVGRMELIKYKNNSIYIDYAHKPDAVLKVLEVANTIKNNKIITIIGCGGNRDKTKRPLMAETSCKNSDYVIFTNDNPRNEDEKDIISDMTKNLKYTNYEIVYDRREAIHRGVDLLNNEDILMILGKGHEDYQIIKDKHIHFSDKEEVLNYIK